MAAMAVFICSGGSIADFPSVSASLGSYSNLSVTSRTSPLRSSRTFASSFHLYPARWMRNALISSKAFPSTERRISPLSKSPPAATPSIGFLSTTRLSRPSTFLRASPRDG